MPVGREWSSLAGVETFNVVVSGGCGANPAADCAALFARAFEEIGRAGIGPSQIVRGRVRARDAALRQEASNARLVALAGERRASSASFIAPGGLAPGVDVEVDLVAMAGAGAKEIREYEPRIAPPMFVRFGGFVFLSGNTDISATFDAQLENICRNIATSLAAASVAWGDIVRVDAFLSNRVAWSDAGKAIRARFPAPVTATSVEGFSAPEKLIEIEATAKSR